MVTDNNVGYLANIFNPLLTYFESAMENNRKNYTYGKQSVELLDCNIANLFQHFEESVFMEERLLQVKSAMLLCPVVLLEIFSFYFPNLKKNIWINNSFGFENLELTIELNF